MIAVAFLRGSAWIEIFQAEEYTIEEIVAFLRGSAWIEIQPNICLLKRLKCRILERECVD